MTSPPADPTSIGPFVVLRKLGEGAMGVVYAGFDKELDRKVALKLVRRELLNKGVVRERMNREAQAMARLSNPYVVQVYQVGEHDGGIYLAMEYIEGDTLTTWLKAQPRPWHVALRTICDAGRGLAAAHAAGLVHRDFKPDNVLVDSDGRPRVLDFGLVQAEGGPSDEELAVTQNGEPPSYATVPPTESVERSSLHWSVRLTQLGNVLGTPAYMSPEQHFGQPAGPYSDQFSFCIVLYEALYGVRPFNGDSWATIRMQVQEGIVPPPSLESQVPRRLFRVLARGLAKAPGDRWPSMDALLEALTHDPWRVRLRVAAIAGGLAAASTASYAFAVSSAGERCEVQSQLDGTWDAAREVEVSRAFAATRTPFATDTWKRVNERLDAYAQVWSSEWRASCEAHASGAQTSRMTDLRVACLSRRRIQLRALVDVFAAADAAVVENAIQAVAALPGIAECGDDETLLAPTTPMPDDPAAVAGVESSREQLAHVEALERTGQYERGLAAVTKLRDTADELDYPPLTAEVALTEGRLLMNVARGAEADVSLVRAVRLGITGDMHAIAAEAAAIRIYVLGLLLEKPAEALASTPMVEALVERARDDGRLSALLLNNLGVVQFAVGDRERSQTSLQRAIEATRRRSGTQDPLLASTYNNLGNLHYLQDSPDAAISAYEQSVELFEGQLGDTHPLIAHPMSGLGDVNLSVGRLREAIVWYARAQTIMEAAYGADHPYMLPIVAGLGRAYAATGRPDEARRLLARAVEIADKHGRRQVELAGALEALGDLAAQDGDSGRARELYERAAAVFDEAVGADSDKGARAALRAGELAAALGDRAGAIAQFERVLAKKSGTKGQAPVRADAALRLAATLAERGPDARACVLVGEGRAGLVEGDPRRAEADALADKACPKG